MTSEAGEAGQTRMTESTLRAPRKGPTLTSGRRVTLIGPNHPSGNPRLVRDADALAAAGFDVRVLGARYVARLVSFDAALVAGRPWRYEAVEFLGGARARLRWERARLRRRACRALAERIALPAVDARAYAYGVPELVKLAVREPADIYVAHQHAMLPVAAAAAEATGALLGFDAEDLLVECPTEPTQLMRRYELLYLPRCAYVTTMSEAAATRIADTNALACAPVALHNTPGLRERGALVSPARRPPKKVHSIYWFGQTVGPHSRAEQVVEALAKMKTEARLVLRGHAIPAYADQVKALAARLGVASRVEIHAPARPEAMVELAGEHDVLFGSQPGDDGFHQMAVGNKVFTGLLAGLAVALTDTVAHRRLAHDFGRAAFLVPDLDAGALARSLDDLFADPARLLRAKEHAWELGTTRFNWEHEGATLVDLVTSALDARASRAAVKGRAQP